MARTPNNHSGDACTTTFEKMGDSIIDQVVGNVMARQSPNTVSVARKGPTGGQEPATANHKSNVLERGGASLHPTATLYKQNAAEASATMRNTRLVPSALGNRDFYAKRQYGQAQQ